MECSKRQNLKICKMSMVENDMYKNELVKIFKAKTKCLKTPKKTLMLNAKKKTYM